MSQYDFGIIDPSVNNGTQLAGFINSFRDAVNSGHSGKTRPDYVLPGMIWVDTSKATAWKLNLYDGSDDVTIATANPQTHTISTTYVPATRKFIAGAGITLNGGASADLSADITIASSGVPVGAVMVFDLDLPPSGFIVGNGAAISRAAYANLDATKYVGDANNATALAWYRCTDPANPNGSRSTTGAYIVTRDLRGLFVRFVDSGRGYDSGRTVGSEQGDQNQAHSHGVNDPGHGHGVNDPGHSHSVLDPKYSSGGSNQGRSSSAGNSNYTSTSASGTGISIAGAATGISIQSSGGAEARPKNIALLGCIKY